MATHEIDNRGLEPPEPMVRILHELTKLEADDCLVALMDREPMLLYPELERRGFAWEFGDAADGFRLTVSRVRQ